MGLKVTYYAYQFISTNGSNRTIVGLKVFVQKLIKRFCVSSNRTIVGLKDRQTQAASFRHRRQQSHHCGIERVLSQAIAGLESCSNRTIVGLKELLMQKIQTEGGEQQSHHCGIES